MPRTESKYNFGSPKEDLKTYMKGYMKIKIPCTCGAHVKRGSLALHKRSNKHLLQMDLNATKEKIQMINKLLTPKVST